MAAWPSHDDRAAMTNIRARRRGRRSCGSWRRCCSPPPSRSTRTTLAARLPDGVDLRAALRRLQDEYAPRGVNLVRIAGKWTFRTASDLAWLLSKETVETRKLSRAAIETLAIIAYHQPVTRAEIEDIRGVSTSKGTLDVLLETGWIRPRGRRKAPGRPLTYGTTEAFLAHFGLDAWAICPGSTSSRARACSTAGCRRASRCRCPPTIRRCATTKTRSIRATSISASRRGRSGTRRTEKGRRVARVKRAAKGRLNSPCSATPAFTRGG